jgi:hypothetical protein
LPYPTEQGVVRTFIKQGDLYPPLRIDTNADTTGATSTVAKLRKVHGSTILTKTLTNTDPTNGILQYQWVAGDTDVPGTYLVEAIVTFASGAIQRFPQRSYLELIIRPKVDA